MKELLQLYTTFAKLGAVTFGGGYAMLPILHREIVEKRHWATEKEIADYYAIGQCTPGVISVNTATFIGEKQKGVTGGIVATLGFITPSLIIITIIATFIQNFADLPVVKDAFAGIRICVCVLILNAVRKLLKSSVIDWPTGLIFISVLLFAAVSSLSPIVFVLLAGVAGILIQKFNGVVS
ncbi:chromate transporter [Bacillus sp. AGMB 02131]|uniref:Chromate transporter n=1 Tax=Peribacillus faecalis TaxID=2772559 RepID=A0A927CYE9_9BACI|nr:chromate transporter [Peribacillus faecalis]MBD3110012.1 chromate transporter [Peribacillus faecalis]